MARLRSSIRDGHTFYYWELRKLGGKGGVIAVEREGNILLKNIEGRLS